MSAVPRIRVVDRIEMVALSMVNKNDLDMTRIESPWSQSGTHTLIFFFFTSSVSVGSSNDLTCHV